MAVETHGPDLAHVLVLLGASVVAVPVFRRLGLGSVLGYLVGGMLVGPFGLGLFSDLEYIREVGELGVVLFLFIIGLEMEPSRLWGLRREIFGLGLAQVGICAALLSCVGLALGFPLGVSFVAAAGFVLTSTAIVMQFLSERGELSAPKGQRVISVLLLEDLAIVPLLAVVTFLAPGGEDMTAAARWSAIGLGLASIAALIAVGYWLLNPFFRLLAKAHTPEIMTSAALLVVLGAAVAMQLGGLSMAMGAFLAGVMLSESSFRHQLEADVEPFRGILLGLFFLSVGMALDFAVVATNWGLILISVTAYIVLKLIGIYAVARFFGADWREATERAVLMAQGGEFAFVLYTAAAQAGLITGEGNAVLTAIIILSMALTPLLLLLYDRFLPPPVDSLEGTETVNGATADVLIIGFGRVGQVVNQSMLARGYSVTIIETNTEAIRAGRTFFGFKIYYGDGSRLDILHAAGAANARAIAVTVDNPETTTRIVELIKSEFPLVPVYARAFDRIHAIRLIKAGVDFQVRETFDSAITLGRSLLIGLGDDPDRADELIEDVRKRDAERLELQVVGGFAAGRSLVQGRGESSTDWSGKVGD